MKITHMATFTTAASLSGCKNKETGESLMSVINLVQGHMGCLINASDEWISAEFYNGAAHIDGISISINDSHSDWEALDTFSEHLNEMEKVHTQWTHGVLYIARGNPSDSKNGKFLLHVMEFDKAAVQS